MNSGQRRLVEILFVIVGVFGIYSYTTLAVPVIHYCDYTGLKIQERIGNEVTFTFYNGSRTYYCGVNVSLEAFQELIDTGQISQLAQVDVRCPMCGMLMAWDDPMIVWVYSENYLNPTTNDPTIVPLCKDVPEADLCESHFIDIYGGVILDNPYIWP